MFAINRTVYAGTGRFDADKRFRHTFSGPTSDRANEVMTLKREATPCWRGLSLRAGIGQISAALFRLDHSQGVRADIAVSTGNGVCVVK